jgi:hypothetical protein
MVIGLALVAGAVLPIAWIPVKAAVPATPLVFKNSLLEVGIVIGDSFEC